VNFALEAVRGLKACWRLVCMDEDGLDDLDVSSDGFWNSFAAIFLVAPLYLYSSAASARLAVPPQSAPYWFTDLAVLALLWVMWPWIMITVSRLLDRQQNYVRYIVANNWSSVYVMSALVFALLLRQLGGLDGVTGALLALSVSLWSMYFNWYIVRTALQVSATTAVMLVAGEIALSIVASLIF
jgi:uncharacterized membrane protein YhaH (DUF805 family)